ncbi:MAG: phosphatase PAP2 family protein [Kaiparowitsia implicata GSE-PSE-MK54-09C]|jgi:undecaprenyl-diphosphatase|nr:phosphatase PAP2 family protein [Kaiparowitsia implicata GSE-PSE-MK54-09C]
MTHPNQASKASIFLRFLQAWGSDRGLALLGLLVGVLLPLQVFAVLALLVWGRVGGLGWDVPLMWMIHRSETAALDRAAAVLTDLGSIWTVIPISVAIALVLYQTKRWRSLLYLTSALLGCVIINRLGKGLWHRARPDLWPSFYPHPQDFSFPSGHAMTSMALAATLGVLLWQSRWRGLALILGGLYVLTIGWTRLYLGVHYPSDIAAGWMVAIAWCLGLQQLIQPSIPPAPTPQTLEEELEEKP